MSAGRRRHSHTPTTARPKIGATVSQHTSLWKGDV